MFCCWECCCYLPSMPVFSCQLYRLRHLCGFLSCRSCSCSHPFELVFVLQFQFFPAPVHHLFTVFARTFFLMKIAKLILCFIVALRLLLRVWLWISVLYLYKTVNCNNSETFMDSVVVFFAFVVVIFQFHLPLLSRLLRLRQVYRYGSGRGFRWHFGYLPHMIVCRCWLQQLLAFRFGRRYRGFCCSL